MAKRWTAVARSFAANERHAVTDAKGSMGRSPVWYWLIPAIRISAVP